MKRKIFAILTGLALSPFLVQAQVTEYPISTASPFLTFSPDARRAAMGDAGVASSPDANSAFWNVAQLAFIEKDMGASIAYTPWLRNLIDDMSIYHGSFYKRLDENQTLGLYLTYFDEGEIQFTDNQGNPLQNYHSKELALTGSYARKLSRNFSMGINLRYINSNLVGSTVVNGVQGKPGRTVAGDLGFYYVKNYGDRDNETGTNLALGATISNIGGKLTYFKDAYFLPANFKIGGSITKRIDAHNRFTYMLDLNKLLVPSPPIRDANGKITAGKDPNTVSTIGAVFSSWGDAPGGMSEEIREFNIATGAEYWYNDLVAVRGGYFFEPISKGGRKYFTAGLGLRLKDSYGLDFAYLIPTGKNSPLADSWRLTFIFNLDGKTSSAPASDYNDN